MKKATFLWFLSFLFFGVFTLGRDVNAELVNLGMFTRDTDAGLYWLDMSLSKDVSAADIMAGTDSRCLSCLGWRHASLEEIQSLLEHAGMEPPFEGGNSPWNYAGAQLVINLLGFTYSGTGPYCTDTSIQAFAGEGPVSERLYMPVVIVGICPEGNVGGAWLQTPDAGTPSGASWPTQGNWLVKESPDWIDIDIKPGSETNSINPSSRGLIPVAILTTDTFDASIVDLSMVLFGATGSETAPVRSALEDVDGDGDIDMILHFKTQETGIQYGDASASLTGGTPDGQIFQGSNCIQTVGSGRCFPPPSGLTGWSWWPGDYNADDIKGGWSADLLGDATFGRGLVGGAFVLDGDGDFIYVPDNGALNVGTGDFTVDLWVFFNDTAGEQILAEKYIQGDNTETCSQGWTLTKLYDNVLLLAMANEREDMANECEDWGVSSDILPIVAGTWNHFAATRLGSEITLFMNGVPVAQGESSLNLDSQSSLKFGHRGNPDDTPGSVDWGGYYLNGRIDEVHLFVGQALTQCQIQAIFNARKAGMCK